MSSPTARHPGHPHNNATTQGQRQQRRWSGGMSSFDPGRGWPPARQSLTSGPPVDLMHESDLRAPPPETEDAETDQPWGNELHDQPQILFVLVSQPQ
jgi:hypothetical protein